MNIPATLPPLVPRSPQQATGHVAVTLSAEDEAYGLYCGGVRQDFNEKRGNRDRNARVGIRTSREVNQHGALAEIAVCRAYGLPLSLVRLTGDFTAPDLANIDVKASWWPNGHLLVRQRGPKAPPERPHVLAVGDGNRWRIPGWVWNWQAQVDGFKSERFLPDYPFAVPQAQLIDPAWLGVVR